MLNLELIHQTTCAQRVEKCWRPFRASITFESLVHLSVASHGLLSPASDGGTPRLGFAPDLICDLPDQSQLRGLILIAEGVASLMGTESALWAETDTLERFFPRLLRPFRDSIGSLVDSVLDLFLVLQLAELGADRADDDVLVLREILQRFESSGSLRVVLEVECVDVEILKQLACNDVVRAFSEMSPADEVASAEMYTGM